MDQGHCCISANNQLFTQRSTNSEALPNCSVAPDIEFDATSTMVVNSATAINKIDYVLTVSESVNDPANGALNCTSVS